MSKEREREAGNGKVVEKQEKDKEAEGEGSKVPSNAEKCNFTRRGSLAFSRKSTDC
jgi:hypothetical protein